MRSGPQLAAVRMGEQLAAVADLVASAVPDPGGRLAAAAARHDEAHQQLSRSAALEVIGLTARRAKNRLRTLRGLEAILRRTEHVHAEGVPCRAERERLIGPLRAELQKLAHQPAPTRRHDPPPIPPAKETLPMRNPHPLAHDPRVGRIVEGSREDPPPRPPVDVSLAELPPVLRPMLMAFESQFAARVFSSLRVEHADRLARMLLDLSPAERQHVLARVLYRLAMRSAR